MIREKKISNSLRHTYKYNIVKIIKNSSKNHNKLKNYWKFYTKENSKNQNSI